MSDILHEILDWVIQMSSPNERYRYSRCIICDATWWDDKEIHNLKCWVPKLKQFIEERRPK